MPRQGFVRILPSGRAVRYLKPGLDDYFKAQEGRTETGKLGLDLLVRSLLPRILTGITAAPVTEIFQEEKEVPKIGPLGETLKDGDGEALTETVKDIDEVAMLESVAKGAGGGWIELTYLKLKEKEDGLSFFDRLFQNEIADFMDLQNEVLKHIFGSKRGVPPSARRTPIPIT